MVKIRIVFKDWQRAEFVAFSLTEAFVILQDYDISVINAINIYPYNT